MWKLLCSCDRLSVLTTDLFCFVWGFDKLQYPVLFSCLVEKYRELQRYRFFILYFYIFPTFPKLSHSCRLHEKAFDLQLQSQREKGLILATKSFTNGNESCWLWKPWLQCWGIMCKLQSKWWGWNLDQRSQAFAQSPTPTISITAYPNLTSLLVLIQYKFIFSSKVFKCLIGEEGKVL